MNGAPPSGVEGRAPHGFPKGSHMLWKRDETTSWSLVRRILEMRIQVLLTRATSHFSREFSLVKLSMTKRKGAPPTPETPSKRRRGRKKKLATAAAATLGFIAGDIPGAVAAAEAVETLMPDETSFPVMAKRKYVSKTKKTYKKRKTVKRKAHKRKSAKKVTKKSVLKLIDSKLNSQLPMGTYKHEGGMTIQTPMMGRGWSNIDFNLRPLNFGSPDDIRYIASTLFNGTAVNLSGSADTSRTDWFTCKGLKVNVTDHEVEWCIRNNDTVEVTVIHYEFLARDSATRVQSTSNNNTGAAVDVDFQMDPIQVWARAYASLNTSFHQLGSNVVPGTLPINAVQAPDFTTSGNALNTTFMNQLNLEPGDMYRFVSKWYKVKRRETRLLPGECKRLRTTNKFKNKLYDFNNTCTDANGDSLLNIHNKKARLQSSWHVWVVENEYVSIKQPDQTKPSLTSSTVDATWKGSQFTNAFRPASGEGMSSVGGVVITYKQKVRMRCPDIAAAANEKDTYRNVIGTGTANTGSFTLQQTQKMSGMIID